MKPGEWTLLQRAALLLIGTAALATAILAVSPHNAALIGVALLALRHRTADPRPSALHTCRGRGQRSDLRDRARRRKRPACDRRPKPERFAAVQRPVSLTSLGMAASAPRDPHVHRSRRRIAGTAAGMEEHRERVRRQQEMIDLLVQEDPDSGALRQQHGIAQAEQWIKLAERTDTPLTLALLGIDVPPGLDQEREGTVPMIRALGANLLEHIRVTDVVMRYQDLSFLVVLPHTDITAARAPLERLLPQASRQIGRAVRGALVQLHLDGADLEHLMIEAEAALHFCRESGVTLADRQFLAEQQQPERSPACQPQRSAGSDPSSRRAGSLPASGTASGSSQPTQT